MAWEVWWALVLGFAISAIVQAWVPRERIERALSRLGRAARRAGDGPRRRVVVVLLRGDRDRQEPVSEGRLGATALAFQFASTNLVWELGLVLWVLIGWQFTRRRVPRRDRDDRADGGCCCALFVSPRLEGEAREHAQRGRHRPPAPHGRRAARTGAERLTSVGRGRTSRTTSAATGRCCGRRSRSGSCSPGSSPSSATASSTACSCTTPAAPLSAIENVVVGPMIAVLSFVCSVGNVPLAAVLWSGGISFAGVLAFLFADLIVLPIVAIYRKYYGTSASRCGSSR